MRTFRTPGHAGPPGAAAVQRPIPRDGHERRRRVQPLEGPRGHALARGRHLRRLGHVLLRPRRGERGVLVGGAPAGAQRGRRRTRRSSPRAGPSSAAGTTTSTPTPRSPSRPRTTSSCAGSRSPTAAARAGRSRSRATRRSSSPRRPPTRCTRRSATSSSRPRSSAHRQAILCTRRPRSAGRALAVDVPPDGRPRGGGRRGLLRDRPHAVHRPRRTAWPSPQALTGTAALSGSAGLGARPDRRHPVPDRPSSPEESATIDVVTGVGETREVCLGLVEKYQDRHLADRVFDLAWTHSQVLLRQINATEADAQLYGRLAGSVIYANAALRADPGVIAANRRGQSGLWGYAISGDLPIVLLQIARPGQHRPGAPAGAGPRLLALKGLAVDLVIWNEDHAGYRQVLQEQIMGLIAAGVEATRDRAAGRHLRAAGGPDIRRGPHPAPGGQPRRRHRQPRPARGPGRPPRRRAARRCRAWCRPGAAAPEAARRRGRDARRPAVLQRARRVHPRRPRVRHHDHAGTGDAGAVGERARQPALRDGRLGERRPPTPGARTPTSSASPPGTTTRSATQRRGLLPPRRGERPLLVAHAAAGPRRDALRHAATASATASSSTRRTASGPSCGCTWRRTRRSSSRC